MSGLKCNPGYKPDKRDINMFLNDLRKSAFTDLGGFKRLLKQEYPTLTNLQVSQLVDAWARENHYEDVKVKRPEN